ncbi:endonuclease/exonuclease/phosphatase family protein [Cellulomonas chengniuliangii]
MVPAARRRLSTGEEATVRHPEARRTRLMTWNVLWRFEPDWRARERAILAVLEEAQPDVLGLQECWATPSQPGTDRWRRWPSRLGPATAASSPSTCSWRPPSGSPSGPATTWRRHRSSRRCSARTTTPR